LPNFSVLKDISSAVFEGDSSTSVGQLFVRFLLINAMQVSATQRHAA